MVTLQCVCFFLFCVCLFVCFNLFIPAESPRVKKQDGGVPGKSRVVFNVSLPLTEGSMLLERTPFSLESPPLEPLDSDFDSEPIDPGEEDLSVAHYFHPARNHQGEHPIPASPHEWQTDVPVAREWLNSASAEWCDWSPTPVEKHKNTHQAQPPPVATDMAGCHVPQTEFLTNAVIQRQSWTLPYRVGQGDFPGYQDYGAPSGFHLPSLFHPATVPSHCSGPAWSKLTVQKWSSMQHVKESPVRTFCFCIYVDLTAVFVVVFLVLWGLFFWITCKVKSVYPRSKENINIFYTNWSFSSSQGWKKKKQFIINGSFSSTACCFISQSE